MENKFSKGQDGKILWCWKCKENIVKGDLIYPYPEDGVNEGKFQCKKCKEKENAKS